MRQIFAVLFQGNSSLRPAFDAVVHLRVAYHGEWLTLGVCEVTLTRIQAVL